MTVILDSTDFDGCVSNQVFRHHKRHKGDVVAANPLLVKHCQLGVEAGDTHYLVSGSMRQSHLYEQANISGPKRASFPEWPKLATAIDATLIPVLLADWFATISPGTAYHQATVSRRSWGHPGCSFDDDSKLLLLLTQMHYAAKLHPEEDIVFRFYDDNAKIIKDLHKFLTKHPELLPKRTRLEVYQYGDLVRTNYQAPVAPSEPHFIFKVSGTGKYLLDNNRFATYLSNVVQSRSCRLTDTVYEKGVLTAYQASATVQLLVTEEGGQNNPIKPGLQAGQAEIPVSAVKTTLFSHRPVESATTTVASTPPRCSVS